MCTLQFRHAVSPQSGNPHRYTLIYLHGLGGRGYGGRELILLVAGGGLLSDVYDHNRCSCLLCVFKFLLLTLLVATICHDYNI